MQHLLNLLAAVALLVWGTHIVRTGILRVFGENLRQVLAESVKNRFAAAAAGLAVTVLVQSSTATCLIASSFVGRGLISCAPALAVMLGADVGSAAMAVVLSFDLSWLSPLFIFVGVVVFVSRESTTYGRLGRVAIGLGLITLALQLIVHATEPMTHSAAVRALLAALPDEAPLHVLAGAALAVLAYSSLATVLLVATLAVQGLLAPHVAFALVVGANLGSGLLAVLATSRGAPTARRLPLGNLLFKACGTLAVLPLVAYLPASMAPTLRLALPDYAPTLQQLLVHFHLLFNLALALAFVGFVRPVGRLVERLLPEPAKMPSIDDRPRHLDPLALDTPSLAISCAAREALHQADLVETMLRGLLTVIKSDDVVLSAALRRMDDTVDELYSAIKYYLTKISREALSERESRRWTDIVSFTINMEQVADIIERVLQDVEDKQISRQRRFSDAGMAEVCHLHERLLANLRLGMSVFLDGHVRDARKLLEEKARFRDLEREYAGTHLARLRDNTPQSIETSSLHIDLISDLKRINSHICSIAYPILESAGVLADTRLKQGALVEEARLRGMTRPAALEE